MYLRRVSEGTSVRPIELENPASSYIPSFKLRRWVCAFVNATPSAAIHIQDLSASQRRLDPFGCVHPCEGGKEPRFIAALVSRHALARKSKSLGVFLPSVCAFACPPADRQLVPFFLSHDFFDPDKTHTDWLDVQKTCTCGSASRVLYAVSLKSEFRSLWFTLCTQHAHSM